MVNITFLVGIKCIYIFTFSVFAMLSLLLNVQSLFSHKCRHCLVVFIAVGLVCRNAVPYLWA
jgi:hypothetical protein